MTTCRGEVRVGLPPDAAIELFTPQGERRWVPGWDPSHPGGDPAACTPGTVFTTQAGGRPTTWVVVDRAARGVRYARVTPGAHAGTVTVRCRPGDGAATVAEVEYRLTALDGAAAGELAGFAAGFEAMLAEWQARIAAALRAGG